MNDVSILFPLPSSKADLDHLLAPSAAGSQGALVPSALYASMSPITGSTLTLDGGAFQQFAAYTDLRVVALRIDPCFASLDPDPEGAGCTAQIRLIFQEVDWSQGSATAFDSALHAFYDLTRDDFLSLARALVALRQANAGGRDLGALAPHPIMVQQGLAGAMSQGVQALILQYAGENNLVRLAEFGTVNNDLEEIWNLSAFDVGTDKTVAVPSPIATLTDGDGGPVFADGLSGSADTFNPDGGPPFLSAGFSQSNDPLDAINPLDDGKPWLLSTPARQAALDALVRVENPQDNSPNTVNCSTCHVATPTEKLVAMPLFAFSDVSSALAFQPDATFVAPADTAVTFNTHGGQFNIHAFSYFGASPGINQRVVNETAAVVAYLNQLPQ
jgi:hypothetical protein